MKTILLTIAIAVAPLLSVTAAAAQSGSSAPVVASAKVGVVDTDSGKVHGYIHHGIYTFRGIPYAKASRFMPPEKPDHWDGVRSTMALALAAVAALFASAASSNANADAPGTKSAWSSSFNDSLWTGSQHSISLSPFADWSALSGACSNVRKRRSSTESANSMARGSWARARSVCPRVSRVSKRL